MARSCSHLKLCGPQREKVLSEPRARAARQSWKHRGQVACWSSWLPGEIALLKMPPWEGRVRTNLLASFFLFPSLLAPIADPTWKPVPNYTGQSRGSAEVDPRAESHDQSRCGPMYCESWYMHSSEVANSPLTITCLSGPFWTHC